MVPRKDRKREMFYIPIQKDFSKVRNKIAFGLTRRQIVLFLAGAAVGIPIYMLTRQVVTNDVAAILMITVMLPFFAFALYEKDGEYLEEILKHIITEKYIRPQIRPVVNEPLIMSCIQVSDYIEGQEELAREAKEKSVTARLRKAVSHKTERTEKTEQRRPAIKTGTIKAGKQKGGDIKTDEHS